MTTVIRATSPADLLGLIPSMLGFTPSESLVFIPFTGARSIGAMRFDLPTAGNIDTVVDQAVGYLRRVPEFTAVLAVVYTAGGIEPATLVLTAVMAHLHRAEISITDLLYVTTDHWGSIAQDVDGPISEIVPNPEAPAVAAGDQTAGTELPVVDPERAQQITERVLVADAGEPYLQMLPLMERTATEELSPRMLAALHWCLCRPVTRDPLLIAWATDADTGAECLMAQMDYEEGEDYPQDLAKIMWGETDEQPDSKRLERALENVRTLLAVAPAAGLYATAAWLSWALGRSSHAEVYAKAGLELEPEHTLCEIVLTFVGSAHLPSWVFMRGAKA